MGYSIEEEIAKVEKRMAEDARIRKELLEKMKKHKAELQRQKIRKIGEDFLEIFGAEVTEEEAHKFFERCRRYFKKDAPDAENPEQDRSENGDAENGNA